MALGIFDDGTMRNQRAVRALFRQFSAVFASCQCFDGKATGTGGTDSLSCLGIVLICTEVKRG